MTQTTINQRVKNIRLALDLDQNMFSKALKFKQGTLSMIENGKANVSKKFIDALEGVFGVRRDYMISGKGGMFENSVVIDGRKLASELRKAFKDHVPPPPQDVNAPKFLSTPINQESGAGDFPNRDLIKMAMEALKSNTEYLQRQLDVALKEVYSRDALIAEHVKGVSRREPTQPGLKYTRREESTSVPENVNKDKARGKNG